MLAVENMLFQSILPRDTTVLLRMVSTIMSMSYLYMYASTNYFLTNS
jgi:hypothetical protein